MKNKEWKLLSHAEKILFHDNKNEKFLETAENGFLMIFPKHERKAVRQYLKTTIAFWEISRAMEYKGKKLFKPKMSKIIKSIDAILC